MIARCAFTGRILALDLASSTGYAVGAPGDVPLNGSIKFEGQSMAARFVGCREFVLMMCAKYTPKIVIFESPMAPSFMRGHTTTNTARVLLGLIAVVEATLYGKGYDVREASVSEVRQFFLGTNLYKSRDAKRATFDRCVELGWKPHDLDAADSLALWAYQVGIVSPADGMKLLPLFGRVRRV